MTRKGKHVEVFEGDDGWYRRLVAGNGQRLGTDGPYTGADNDARHNAIVGARDAWPDVPVYIVGDEARRLVPHPSTDEPPVEELRRPFPIEHDEPEPDGEVRPSQP